jgi:hypothetical protein
VAANGRCLEAPVSLNALLQRGAIEIAERAKHWVRSIALRAPFEFFLRESIARQPTCKSRGTQIKSRAFLRRLASAPGGSMDEV